MAGMPESSAIRHEVDARHFGDERIALRHVTDGCTYLLCIRVMSCPKICGRARSRGMKAEQGVDERSLARAVGPDNLIARPLR